RDPICDDRRSRWRGHRLVWSYQSPFSTRADYAFMNYYSRLSDIVTCNLTEMLANEADPASALPKIIAEMEEGLAGARRSVATASATEGRLQRESGELAGKVEELTADARNHLVQGDESAARLALIRRQEVADVIAGLEQQL